VLSGFAIRDMGTITGEKMGDRHRLLHREATQINRIRPRRRSKLKCAQLQAMDYKHGFED